MNTWKYLEDVRTLNGGCTDYRLAKLLEIEPSALYRYRDSGREMDDDVAARAAALLGLPAAEVIANVRAARAESFGDKNLVKVWREMAGWAHKYGRAAVVVGAFGLAASSGGSCEIRTHDQLVKRELVVHRRWRRSRRVIRRTLPARAAA